MKRFDFKEPKGLTRYRGFLSPEECEKIKNIGRAHSTEDDIYSWDSPYRATIRAQLPGWFLKRLRHVANERRDPNSVGGETCNHGMFNFYGKGYELPQHFDNGCRKFVIAQLYGEPTWLRLARYQGSRLFNEYTMAWDKAKKRKRVQLKTGDLLLLDKAACLEWTHGLGALPSERGSLVCRWYTQDDQGEFL